MLGQCTSKIRREGPRNGITRTSSRIVANESSRRHASGVGVRKDARHAGAGFRVDVTCADLLMTGVAEEVDVASPPQSSLRR
jgi:hypothetical protein